MNIQLHYLLIWGLLTTSGSLPLAAQTQTEQEAVSPHNRVIYLPKQERLFLQEVELKQKITTEGRAATIRLAEVYSNMDAPEMRAKVESLMAPLAEEGYVKAQWLLAYGDTLGRYGTFSDANAKRYQATQKSHEMRSSFFDLMIELARDKQYVSSHLTELRHWYRENHSLCSNPPKGAPTKIDSPEDYIAVRYLTDCLFHYETQSTPEKRLLALAAYQDIVCSTEKPLNCFASGLKQLAIANKETLTTSNNPIGVARALTVIRFNQYTRFYISREMESSPKLSKSTQWEIDFARGAISDKRDEDAIRRLKKYQNSNNLLAPDRQYVALFLGLSQMESSPSQAIQNLHQAIEDEQLSPWLQLLAEDMLCKLYMSQKRYTDLIHIRLKQFSRLPEKEQILPARLFENKT